MLAKFEQPPLPIHIVYPTSRLLSAKVRSFIDLVVELSDWHLAKAPSFRGARSANPEFEIPGSTLRVAPE